MITQKAMVDTIAQMQGKMDSKSMRRSHAGPMTDLAARFPTLELMTDSRGPEDGVLCVTSSKEAEEGRLWDLILPEIPKSNEETIYNRLRQTLVTRTSMATSSARLRPHGAHSLNCS